MQRFIAVFSIMALVFGLFSNGFITKALDDTTVKGIDFPAGNYYEAAEQTLTLPSTYEATICLPNNYTERGGVIFGMYDGDKAHPIFNFEIYSDGTPRIYIIGNDTNHTVYDIKFENVNVCKGKLLHLAITVNHTTGTWRCYVDGSLKQVIYNDAPEPFSFESGVCLGGDLRDQNSQNFKGIIGKVALYTDTRSTYEVSQDAVAVEFDTDNILCAYDMSDNTVGDYPDYINSKAGIPLNFKGTIMWYKNIPEPENYDYSFAVLGDIQSLTYYYPSKLPTLFDWVKNNTESQKIEFCVGLGDITDKNTESEYKLVKQQYEKLKGTIPFSIVRGNHDRETGAASAMFEKHITQAAYSEQISGSYDSTMLNTYRIIKIGQVKYLFLSLDFVLKNDVLEWANQVILENQDCQVIVSTHIYFGATGNYYDIGEGTSLTRYGCENNGQALWDKVLSKHKNVVMLICGHNPTDNIYYRQKTGDYGNKVTEILIDPQQTDRNYGGVGLVAMFYFSNNGKDLEIRYYSTVNGYYFKANNQISLTLDVPGYTVSFGANGGSGEMADVTDVLGEYVLPQNNFTAPNGKQFEAWSVNGVQMAVGDIIKVSANTTVTAVWKNMHDCDFKLDKIIDPTCTQEGYTVYRCTICGDCYNDNITEPKGHSCFDEYTIDKLPTCLEKGQISRHCKDCDYVTDEIVIEANGHTGGKYVTVTESDCNQTGVIHEYCKVCDSFLSEIITPITHNYGLWSWIVSPNSSYGIKTHSCTICNHTETVMANTLDNLGDLNNDDKIDVLDYIYMMKLITEDSGFVTESDMNDDNICNIKDLILLKKYILGA